ncbi:hypothetical protein ACFV1T_32675, partial [Streptomyces vinaceus]
PAQAAAEPAQAAAAPPQAAPAADSCDRGPSADPLDNGRCARYPLPAPFLGHFDYQADPAFAAERDALLARLAGPARRARSAAVAASVVPAPGPPATTAAPAPQASSATPAPATPPAAALPAPRVSKEPAGPEGSGGPPGTGG